MRTATEKLMATTKESVGNCDELEIVSFSSTENQAFAMCISEKGYLLEFKIDDLEMVGYVPINV